MTSDDFKKIVRELIDSGAKPFDPDTTIVIPEEAWKKVEEAEETE